LASSVKTAGLGNPVVATAETGTAIGMSALSIFLPVVAIVVVIIVFVLVYWLIRKFKKK
jgi:phosphotransferase system  glucose/maltose/N-acetylglucosamine-specific IIC component